MEAKQDLITGRISTTLLRFAIPYLISSFLQALYGAADLYVVGQFAGAAAVSAVATGSQVMMTITGIILGLSMGGTVRIGNCIGAKNPTEAANSVGSLTFLLVLCALVLTPLFFFGSGLAVGWMQTPVEAVAQTLEYLKICSLGIPFIIGYNAVSGIFRGLGDSKTPMVFIAIACVCNIGLDFCLVGGFHLAAAGAAWATILAQGISFLLSLVYLWKRGFPFPFSRRCFFPRRQTVQGILKVGVPLALQDSLVHISFLLITAIINTLGVVASAAVGVVEKIIGFAMLPPGAFSGAIAAMVAQNVGAGEHRRAQRILMYGILYSLVCGVLVFAAAQWWPEAITGVFSKDAAVVTAAADYFGSYALDCILVSFVFCINGYLNGCGNSVFTMTHSLAATFLVRIPLSYALHFISSAEHLYPMGFAAPAASLVSILLCCWYFLWRRKKGASLR